MIVGGALVSMVMCSGSAGNSRQAQADVSNSFSIISSTSSARYLWYFSGFLVKVMLAHLEEQQRSEHGAFRLADSDVTLLNWLIPQGFRQVEHFV